MENHPFFANRILLVDDEEPILYALSEYFRTFGFDVDCAQEMEEAQALLSNVHYSVAIVDMRLTGINRAEGLEIIGYARERCPWTRIIVWTGSNSPEVEAEARRRGVDAFLRKPKPLSQVAQVAYRLMGASYASQNAVG